MGAGTLMGGNQVALPQESEGKAGEVEPTSKCKRPPPHRCLPFTVTSSTLKRMVNLTTRCPQRGRNNPAILTAAPFRGLPQPEAHGRRKFNDRLSMNQLPRRALSRYGLTFQGNILSVNCQCRMLTRVRRTHSTSPVENSLSTNLSFVG